MGMNDRVFQRSKRRDRFARWAISIGGVGVIGCVLLMLLLIVAVTLPLFKSPRAGVLVEFPVPAGAPVLAIGMDDYRETGYVLRRNGVFTFFDLRTGAVLDELPARRQDAASAAGATAAAPAVEHVEASGKLLYSLGWSDGAHSLVQVEFTPSFQTGRRVIRHRVEALASFAPAPGGVLPGLVRHAENGGALEIVFNPAAGRFQFRREIVRTDLLGGEERETAAFATDGALPGRITAFTADAAGATLYAGTDNGFLLRWIVDERAVRLLDTVHAFADNRAVTAMDLVFGDVSLAVGDATGQVTTWMPVRMYGEGSDRRLDLIHTLSKHAAPVRAMLPAQAGKRVVSQGEDGRVRIDYMTSERHLFTIAGNQPLDAAALSHRGDSLIALDRAGGVRVWDLECPHPETAWRVFFGKVWYENYDRPEFVWQSSAANDDAELKFSFVPLIAGSLKGTLYALIFAVPVALLGAIYTSQFTTYEIKGVVKPVVEIMAAIPSVVIGFLAALWLAPRIEAAITGVFLFAVTVPLAFVLFMGGWTRVRRFGFAKRIEHGFEFLLLIPVLLLAAGAALGLGPVVEKLFFGGDFRLWLFHEAGMRYDQRNSIIISFALGFAVIPIIFTIAEDALSNVPKSLKAASLALGASRWQTVWRVILPSASPGVFAAIIIGFGRAVGETMIVLMATGNTPVLDWGPFSGMRTLSANIAVEIPEAPAGGTLYRMLFLSAVLLFLLTSVLNTAAELIRHRLRKKYGQFQ